MKGIIPFILMSTILALMDAREMSSQFLFRKLLIQGGIPVSFAP